MKIFINNEVLTNKDLSANAIAAFIALKALQRKDMSTYFITVNELSYMLCDRLDMSRKYKERLADGLNELIENKTVTVVEQNGKEYILNLDNILIEHKQQYFTVIELSEVQRICNISHTKANRFSILRYFVAMMSTINHSDSTALRDSGGNIYKKGFVGFCSMEYIGSLCGISSGSTLHEYTKILEEEELIYVYRSDEIKHDIKTGKFRNYTNHYGRFEDAADIRNYGIDYNSSQGFTTVNKSIKNNGRSLAAKYCWLCKGRAYSKEEIEEIYQYCSYKNWELRKEIDRCGDAPYKKELIEKLRDMSVFDKYSFLDKLRERDFNLQGDKETIDKIKNKRKNSLVITRGLGVSDDVSDDAVDDDEYTLEEILEMPSVSDVEDTNDADEDYWGEVPDSRYVFDDYGDITGLIDPETGEITMLE